MTTDTLQARPDTEAEPFAEWCIVELMGRVRFAGFVTEQKIAGGQFLRVDIHGLAGPAVMTQLIPPPPGGPVYRITPTTEALARQLGARQVPAPVSRWEIPAADPDPGDDDEPFD